MFSIWVAALLVVLVVALYEAFPVMREFDRAFTHWIFGERFDDRF